ncbi:MAG: SGNH/GDSL hydrolase family protein [Candidatus Latescibacteria bacterium]|nr:SGNH/GDSL hydrolase family protein [Candidatus Latescibacterota bacterium]MBT4136645.1 SGNH/GDSL hydrolase family protein [Candidatus Latescibacterota bacterium]MBT5832725.1 SGNH/GDSL hydrolase family protein [Candidatus Latescibacterota bacterium]
MTIVFFGDSICFGEKVNPHKTWIARLSAEFEKRFDNDLLVINASINGNTTRLALERMPSDVQKYNPQLLFIQFGMNDCNFWQTDQGLPRVSPKAFLANLNEITDRGLNFGAQHIFVQTNHPTLRTTPFEYANKSYEESNAHYNEIIRAFADMRTEVRLIDMAEAWSEQLQKGTMLSDLLLDDELHLSIQGHKLYLEETLPILFEVIADLQFTE